MGVGKGATEGEGGAEGDVREGAGAASGARWKKRGDEQEKNKKGGGG